MFSRWISLLLLVAGLLLGCGSDEVVKPGPVYVFPPNDTPENTILRFIAAYERMDSTVFTQLFTGEYQFKFSEMADPDLVNEYASGWFKADEHVSARNLFHGGVNNDGTYQVGAQTIELEFTETSPQGDTATARDPAVFKTLETPIQLTIQLPPDENDPEGTTFRLGGLIPISQRFSLVRGDVADSLDSGQPADDKHWYIWLWEDAVVYECRMDGSRPTVAGESRPQSVCASTWGQIKGIYR